MHAVPDNLDIAQLVRQLNACHFTANPLICPGAVATIDGGIGARYRDLSLRSQLRQIFTCEQPALFGTEAGLRAYRGIQPVADPAATVAGWSPQEQAGFASLCLALHVLNFCASGVGGLLLLPPVPDSPPAQAAERDQLIESLLRACGIAPARVVMQLDAASRHRHALEQAVQRYRRQGYLIGITGLSYADLLGWVAPPVWVDYINLSPAALAPAERSPAVQRSLALRLEIIRLLNGNEFIVTEFGSATHRQLAIELGVFALAAPTAAQQRFPAKDPAMPTATATNVVACRGSRRMA